MSKKEAAAEKALAIPVEDEPLEEDGQQVDDAWYKRLVEKRVAQYQKSQSYMTQCIKDFVEDERDLGEMFPSILEMFCALVGASVHTVVRYIRCIDKAQQEGWFDETLELGHFLAVYYRSIPIEDMGSGKKKILGKKTLISIAAAKKMKVGEFAILVQRNLEIIEGFSRVRGDDTAAEGTDPTGGAKMMTPKERARAHIELCHRTIDNLCDTIETLSPDDVATAQVARAREITREDW